MLKKKDWVLCSIATAMIIVLIGVGHRSFREQMLTLQAVWILAIAFLPFYVVSRIRKGEERATVEFEIEKTFEECSEELEALASEIGKYNPEESEESPTEYLSGIQWEIQSIADTLKGFRNRLEDYHSSY